MLHYNDLINCLSHHLPITDVPELIIMYICNDNMIDWFTIPRKIQQRIENQFCATTITYFAKETRLWNNLHSCGDIPTIEYNIGSKMWYKNGLLHRYNNLPAIEYYDGEKVWYKNGQRHRDNDLPAIEHFNGTKAWYKNGKLHRDNDQPAIEWVDGTKEWYKNGKRYRDHNLPAVE